MAHSSSEFRGTSWSECCGFFRIFKSLGMACSWVLFRIAVEGILLTLIVGFLLDAAWSSTSQPIVIGEQDELQVYLAGGGSDAVAAWRDSAMDSEVKHTGCFNLMRRHAGDVIQSVSTAVLSFRPDYLLAAIGTGIHSLVWLVVMHPLFALLFFLASVTIWAYHGGMLCRIAACEIGASLYLERQEAHQFVWERKHSLVSGPILQVSLILVAGLLLYVGGLMTAVPWVGDVLLWVLFLPGIILGLLLALLLLIGFFGFPLMFPVVVADDRDGLEAFVFPWRCAFERPFKAILYWLTAAAFGSVCYSLLKFLAGLTFWAIGTFAGTSLNMADTDIEDDGGAVTVVADSKLEAIWQAPGFMATEDPYGTLPAQKVRGFDRVGQTAMIFWVFVVSGLVVPALGVSFFFCAATIIYFLLRRDVDNTDMEEVCLEGRSGGAA